MKTLINLTPSQKKKDQKSNLLVFQIQTYNY